MPGRGLIVAGCPVLVALAALVAACGGGGGNGDATPSVSPPTTEETRTATGTVVATPAEGPSPTQAPDIRQEDLTEQPGLRDFVAGAGGEASGDRITYVDLTNDGVEDAVVPVSSGGEGGDIAVFVFGYGPGGLQELLQVVPEDRSLSASVVDGVLTVAEPVFAPGDPLCCPSEIRTTTYGWDGNRLVVSDQTVEPAGGN